MNVKLLDTGDCQLCIGVTIKTSNSILIFDGVLSILSSSFGFFCGTILPLLNTLLS